MENKPSRIAVSLPTEVSNELAKIARRENRSVSNVAGILIKEALRIKEEQAQKVAFNMVGMPLTSEVRHLPEMQTLQLLRSVNPRVAS